MTGIGILLGFFAGMIFHFVSSGSFNYTKVNSIYILMINII